MVENEYKYRDGAPIYEYFYNCGKVLGQIHRLSKKYRPEHRRYSFFNKFNATYIDETVPAPLTLLNKKLKRILSKLKELPTDTGSYGMLHFDFNDGNYTVDFDTGQITAFDFDNSLYGWYMYDLAGLWAAGVGWAMFESDACKRRETMEKYFSTVLDGYKSETNIDNTMLDRLPLFINANSLESVLGMFADDRDNGEDWKEDESLRYMIKCIEDDIPYQGLFHEIYSCEHPFEYMAKE